MLRPLQQSEGHEQVTSRSLQNSALSLAWIIALVSTLGALFIGEVMGQTPCVLCWYQRIAMFPLALILGIAAYLEDTTIYRYVLPISIVGGLIAFWHSLLFIGIVPEIIQPCELSGPSCAGAKQTVFGIVPLPFLSFAAFVAITFLLLPPYLKRLS